MAQIKNGALVTLGPTLVTDDSASGAFTTPPAQAAAPASGVPSP
jgi:hypothetical protein